ncbi:hypothetical protein E4U57_000625 [Claviceps arundinis]|uniref:Mitochondrial genome maintenance protein MGM101 n=1 Tax=Claviceps arundinis TaxID=1623583 RepID=A0ABQ7PCM0_9HYPO|nr:hypothetical protein E4U57_000625 [Claviceps arundinis]
MLLSRRAVLAASARVLPQRIQFAARFYAADAAPASEVSPETAAPSASKWSKSKATTTAAAATPLKSAVYDPLKMVYNDPDNSTESKSAKGSATLAPDWTNSFHGISTKPVSKEQFKNLVTPLDVADIEVKPDGILYLPEIKYRRKLNETFGPMGWGLIPKSEAVVGNSIVTREYALIIDGRFVSQAQGENNYFGPDQLPSAVEGCKSNALMRCCKDIGIGSELWDPQFLRWFKKTHVEEVWVEHMVTKKKRTVMYKKGLVQVAYPYKLTK